MAYGILRSERTVRFGTSGRENQQTSRGRLAWLPRFRLLKTTPLTGLSEMGAELAIWIGTSVTVILSQLTQHSFTWNISTAGNWECRCPNGLRRYSTPPLTKALFQCTAWPTGIRLMKMGKDSRRK